MIRASRAAQDACGSALPAACRDPETPASATTATPYERNAEFEMRIAE